VILASLANTSNIKPIFKVGICFCARVAQELSGDAAGSRARGKLLGFRATRIGSRRTVARGARRGGARQDWRVGGQVGACARQTVRRVRVPVRWSHSARTRSRSPERRRRSGDETTGAQTSTGARRIVNTDDDAADDADTAARQHKNEDSDDNDDNNNNNNNNDDDDDDVVNGNDDDNNNNDADADEDDADDDNYGTTATVTVTQPAPPPARYAPFQMSA
jgi:hypothetical protein